jgi:cellulose synthase/poly-beta-1,6-N-acetylglucosamine synthase-like glycosyltransferase
LVVGEDESLSPSAADLLGHRLAASGTALYVLDVSPHGSSALASLASDSGGFVARLGAYPATSALDTAFAQILDDLGNQYYLTFYCPMPLPGRADVVVHAAGGSLVGTVTLPASNPVAPALPVPARPRPPGVRWDLPLVGSAMLLVILALLYGFAMLVASRREPRRPPSPMTRNTTRPSAPLQPSCAGVLDMRAPPPRDDLFFVFLLPCLNEEKVILASLQRLLSIPGCHLVVVIDDGSDDATAAVVSSVVDERVWLVQRTAPDARQGKGEALNAAVREVTSDRRLAGRDPDRVVAVVVDADGRLDPHAVEMVSPYFDDPMVGAVQIGVRINNRHRSWLARMQDMEFVIYTEVFQRGRRHLGSVGLGGNGQFMRLSALLTLGPAPWTRSLTDDLDLGIRFLTAGWRNEYCSTAAVHQQGVVQLRRLIRQRSRWFQGHLQSWKLIPEVLRSAPRRARTDLLYHLSSPALLLIGSLLSMSFLLSLADSTMAAAEGRDPFGWWVVSSYLLTFGPALAFSYVYWTRERDNGMPLIRAGALAHLYVGYGLIWYASGWWAVGRTLRGRTGWAKTDRVAEAAPAASAEPPPNPRDALPTESKGQ